ncbi:(2Fe-2S)-binding protein [soil metagenome]
MTRFTVNDAPVEYLMDPQTPLLWALRDASNLTGTKYGCGTGHCGACTVDIDGAAVRACQVTIAAIEGSFVTTIEGLSADRSHPAQLAFIAENVTQCGFCIPGMIMATAVLLKHNRDPSEDDIRKGITNLCRCGVYPRLVEAIQRAARVQRDDEAIAPVAAPHTTSAAAVRAVPALSPRR